MMSVLRKIAWVLLRALFGIVSLIGAVMVGWSSVALFLMVTGRVQVYFDQPPPVAGLGTVLVIGIVFLVSGYKAPNWLDLDRLL